MAFTKMRALVKKDLQYMGRHSASGETALDKAKEISAAFAEPIGVGLKYLGKSVSFILTEIGKIDVAIGDALGFAELQEQFRFTKEHNLKMNQVAIELVGVRIRRISKQYDLGIEGYSNVFSFENFTGNEAKYELYSEMSMEGLGNVVNKIIDKVKGFFSKLWDNLKDAFSSAVNLREHLIKKIKAYEEVLPHIEEEPTKDTFKSNKKMREGIFEPDKYTSDSARSQFKRQHDAFDLVPKFTNKVLSDLQSFESTFRKDPEKGMEELTDNLLKFKEFSFGSPREPLGGMVYYDVEVTDEDSKNVRIVISRQKASVISNSSAEAETLKVEEMEKILDASKTMLALSDIAFDTYQKSLQSVKQVKTVAERDLRNVPDKELSSLAKSYLTLYEGIFALCPALAILILDTNLKSINGGLVYIDESLKCY